MQTKQLINLNTFNYYVNEALVLQLLPYIMQSNILRPDSKAGGLQ